MAIQEIKASTTPPKKIRRRRKVFSVWVHDFCEGTQSSRAIFQLLCRRGARAQELMDEKAEPAGDARPVGILEDFSESREWAVLASCVS